MGGSGGGLLIRPARIAAAALGALLLLAGAGVAGAQPMPVPPKLQMAIFKKVFQYDRTLAGRGPVRVLVVHGGDVAAQLEDVLASFEFAQIDAAPVHHRDLADRLDGTTVLYILPGVPTSAYMDRCVEDAILTISGHPSLAQRGSVSIAVGLRGDGKPEVIVHRGRLKAEQHDVSAELLKVARVLQ